MVKIENKKRYYILNIITNEWISSYDSFQELIYYVAQENGYNNSNIILDNINLTLNDKKTSFAYDIPVQELRRYVILDEDYKIIDLRLYSDLIFNEDYIKQLESTIIKNKKYNKSRKQLCKKRSWCRGKAYHPKGLKKELINEQIYKEYRRNKRFNNIKDRLSYEYNYSTYHFDKKGISKSWKDNTKRKHQYKFL